MNLTREQELFRDHDNECFLEACPGAGKTRAIVARLKRISPDLEPRRSVGVLSFTNKAVEELHKRLGSAQLLRFVKHPGFVGTVDGFVRRFLFEPFGIPGLNMSPQLVDSWDSLGVEVRIAGVNNLPGVSLDAFAPITNIVDPASIRQNAALRQHVENNQNAYQRSAAATRQRLNRSGYFSAADARAIANQRISAEPVATLLGRMLAARFKELIVDEGQDCNPQDLAILTWLRQHGVRVTMVCDMDQSIFEFRDGERRNIEAFAGTYPAPDRLRLTGNFRSSAGVCNFSATLRAQAQPDMAVGDHAGFPELVAIRPYAGRPTVAIGTWFVQYAVARAMSAEQVMVLAHNEQVARTAAGGHPRDQGHQSKVHRWARIVETFWRSGSKHSRVSALSAMERLLLDVGERLQVHESVLTAVKRLSLNPRELRRHALECVTQVPRTCEDTDVGRQAWLDSARELLGARPEFLPRGRTVRQVLAMPRTNDWSQHLIDPGVAATQLRYSTIHNAKGGEYDAVLLVIPPDNNRGFTRQVFDAWAGRQDHESKRVLYVGATRASRLLAVAIPQAYQATCVALLRAANVAHQLVP